MVAPGEHSARAEVYTQGPATGWSGNSELLASLGRGDRGTGTRHWQRQYSRRAATSAAAKSAVCCQSMNRAVKWESSAWSSTVTTQAGRGAPSSSMNVSPVEKTRTEIGSVTA